VADMERNFDLIVSMRTQLNGLLGWFYWSRRRKSCRRHR